MRKRERKVGSAAKSIHAVSEFTHELIKDLARERYSLQAWQRFLSRSWVRSLEDIRKVPARTGSFLRWAVVVAVIGMGIILLALTFHDFRETVPAVALWLPWYAAAVLFVLTHLGMVDDRNGSPHTSLLLPNALSFVRLGLAPLVMWPCLNAPAHPVTGPIFALFLAVLALTDVLDGWLARSRNACTRMGHMLDPVADLAYLTFLAVGLFAAGVLPMPLFALLMVRYPGVSVVVLVLYFARGPAALRPTLVGKATGLATNAVLITVAFMFLLQSSWPPAPWVAWSARVLSLLVVVNLLYLLRQAARWKRSSRFATS